jgi:signal transduction histidine kinase
LWLQILLPVSGLTVVAVAVNALFAVAWTTQRHEEDARKRIEQMSAVLAQTSFTQSAAVLDKLHQLTNSHFAVVGGGAERLPVTTLKGIDPAAFTELVKQPSPDPMDAPRRVVLGGETYLMRVAKPARATGETLIVLLPEQDLARERWRAVVPPLLVGAVSLMLLVPLTLLVARRFGRRIARVQEKVARVASSHDEPIQDEWQYEDEIHDLVCSVNDLGSRLRELQSQLVESERTRLLGQFAAGMAHTIRNSIAGARLAVQLHLKRNPSSAGDTSLQVALRQLTLTEQQLRGMLAVGRSHDQHPTTIGVNAATREVLDLIVPVAAHARVTLNEHSLAEESFLQSDPDRLRAALLNLVLNAIEAAGAEGCVGVNVASSAEQVSWTIEDSGHGPPPNLAEQLGQPFVTGKPNGVGLGLALVRQVAEDSRGRLRWFRRDNRTCFELALPRNIQP